MKKVMFLLFALSMVANAQRISWSDSIAPGAIGGSDTVIFKPFNSGGNYFNYGFYKSWSVEFNYANLDTSVVLSVGGSNFGNTYNEYVNDSIPYTANPKDTNLVNGVSTATVGISGSNHPYKYFGVKVTKITGATNSDSTFLYWKFYAE